MISAAAAAAASSGGSTAAAVAADDGSQQILTTVSLGATVSAPASPDENTVAAFETVAARALCPQLRVTCECAGTPSAGLHASPRGSIAVHSFVALHKSVSWCAGCNKCVHSLELPQPLKLFESCLVRCSAAVGRGCFPAKTFAGCLILAGTC